MRLTCCPRPCQAGPWVTPSWDSGRTREKVLEGWKVYAGTSNLHQLPEAASVAQVIINGNYTDEQDDYDIALMRLSRPLALSGEWVGAWHTRAGCPGSPRGPALALGSLCRPVSGSELQCGGVRSRDHVMDQLCFTARETEAQSKCAPDDTIRITSR